MGERDINRGSCYTPPMTASNPLTIEEIGLIKGLTRRGNLTQQAVIAHFSHPSRTVSHNLVSQIARGVRYSSDIAYPPASEAACDFFLQRAKDGLVDECLLSLVAVASNRRADPDVYSFAYFYHPVGQGLFCSGRFSRPHQQPFRWVYDCGTDLGRRGVKRGEHVHREIARLASEQAGDPPHLDLVTLSHFDEDHLSGILDLVGTFTIGTLLLPYLTPWHRLEIALIEGAAVGDDLLDFLAEPTAFLLERAEGRIERIVLVPASGDGPALPPLLGPDESPPEGRAPEGEPEIEIKAEPAKGEPDDAAGADGGLSDPKVSVLVRGGTITVGRAWEFLPYNDAIFAKSADAAFRAKAQPLADQLRRSTPAAARKTALDTLLALYDVTFKKGAKVTPFERNVITLFLYSGPIGRVALLDIVDQIPRHRLKPIAVSPYRYWEHNRFGQLLTGDGYLKTPAQWASFETFYGAQRLSRGGIFQVMHHGSAKNWHKGIAAKLDPQVSVFCSDPASKHGHPDWDVLKDFSGYNPKQVDYCHGWAVEGNYRFL